jgi:hypothetical protein
MPQINSSQRYRVFLLSVWCDGDRSEMEVQQLRFRLEDPHTGERRGFDGSDSMVSYLIASLSEHSDEDQISDPAKGEN